MCLSDCCHYVSFGFAEICVSLSKEEIKMNETEHADVKSNNKWVWSFYLPPGRCITRPAAVVTAHLWPPTGFGLRGFAVSDRGLWHEMVKCEPLWGSENIGTNEKARRCTAQMFILKPGLSWAGIQPTPHNLNTLQILTLTLKNCEKVQRYCV